MQPISHHSFPCPMISYFNPFQLSFVEQNLDDVSLTIDAHSWCFVSFSPLPALFEPSACRPRRRDYSRPLLPF